MVDVLDCPDIVGLLLSKYVSSLTDLLVLRSVCKTFQSYIDNVMNISMLSDDKIMLVHWIIVNGDGVLLEKLTKGKKKSKEQTILLELVYYGIMETLQNISLEHDTLYTLEIESLEKLLVPTYSYWDDLWVRFCEAGMKVCNRGRFYGGWVKLREFFLARFDLLSQHINCDVNALYMFFFNTPFKAINPSFLNTMICHIPDQHFDKILNYFEANLDKNEFFRLSQNTMKHKVLLSIYSAQSNVERYIEGLQKFQSSGVIITDQTIVNLAIPSRSPEILRLLRRNNFSIQTEMQNEDMGFISYHLASIRDEEIRKDFMAEIYKLQYPPNVLMSAILYVDSVGARYMMDNCVHGLDPLYQSFYDYEFRSKLKPLLKFSPGGREEPQKEDRKLDFTPFFSLLNDVDTTEEEIIQIQKFIDDIYKFGDFDVGIDFQLLCWMITRRIFKERMFGSTAKYKETTKFIKEKFMYFLKSGEKKCFDTTHFKQHHFCHMVQCILQMERHVDPDELPIFFSYFRQEWFIDTRSYEHDLWKFYRGGFQSLRLLLKLDHFASHYIKESFRLGFSDEQISILEKEFPQVVSKLREKEQILEKFKLMGFDV